tara:strand:+ start:50 stop:2350 length:2301 start_codon:yes stop_codon:yes gene_type:complete
MNEEEEKKDPEEELKEELERYERQNQEAYDEVTKGNEELRRRAAEEQKRIDEILEDRPGETSIERRRRISRQMGRYYKGRGRLPSDADIQTEGNLRGEPTPEEIFRKRTPEEIAEAEKGAKEARRIIEQGKKDRGEDYDPNFAQSIGFEVGANVALDKATAGLLVAPIPGARVLYALSNVAGSGIINYLAQRIRGTEFSLGELATASGLSLVPGGTQAKTLKGAIGKSTVKGAGLGATQVTSESLIDTGKLPDAETLTTGALFGGVAGGIFETATKGDDIGKFFNNLRNRLNGGKQLITPEGIPIDSSDFQPPTAFAIKNNTGSKGFGSLPKDGDLSDFLASKRNRYDVADLSLRKANIDPKSKEYKRIQRAARQVPEFVRRNDEGFLYFDYRLFRDSMRPKQYGRAYIELFETDLDVLMSGGAGTAGTKAFKEFNIAEFRDTFKPAAELLGLTGKYTPGRMDVSNVHHIAALKGIMGIYDGLGFNSPMYKQVNKVMKESLDGLGSEQENFIRLVGGTADVDSPHYLAHLFLSDTIGASGEKFFTDDVLINMSQSDNVRISKARELGRIIADSAKVAERAQEVYKRLANAALATEYDDIQRTMERLLASGELGFIKTNNVNYKPFVREKLEAGGYVPRTFEKLIEDISLIHKAIPSGSPKLIDEILFSPQLLKAQNSFQRLVTKIEEKFGEQGITGAQMRKLLDSFDVRMQNAGRGQTGLFEDIPDNLMDDALNTLDAKIQAKKLRAQQKATKKNQELYQQDEDLN